MARSGRLFALAVVLLIIILLAEDSSSWWRRRRRRRRRCYTNNWGRWSGCSRCGYGTRWRYRSTTCGVATSSSSSCYRSCRVNCVVNNWVYSGNCNANCGYGYRGRRRYVNRYPSGGGSRCPNLYSNTGCYAYSRCRVNCAVNNWGSWSSCSGGCYSIGYQYRRRYVSRYPKSGGSSCPTVLMSKSCRRCCATNCVLNSWSSYGSCSASCGRGTQASTRYVSRYAYCGGSGCSSYTRRYRTCYAYSYRSCQVNNWGGWSGCSYRSGSCGSGTRYRSRYVRVSQVCRGAGCPALRGSQACSTCCPRNCAWSSWNSYSRCSTSCGVGYMYRYRSVQTTASCGGSCSGGSSQRATCTAYTRRDCVLAGWGPYTPCTNPCGQGTQTRYRRVISQATCGGSCGATTETRTCSSYTADRNCQVGGWNTYTACSSKCSVGTKYRYRTITSPAVCRGTCSYSTTDSAYCGYANGGCAQLCNNGVCSCNAGYYSVGQTCKPRSCGAPTVPTYCPSGSICKVPTLSCTSGYVYKSTCTLTCVLGYSIKGSPSTITCLSSTAWTDHSTAHCELDNRPPTDIYISYSYLNENSPSGTVIGTFTTKDPNPSDSHRYTLTNSAGGRFRIVSSRLVSAFVPNFETQPHSYTVDVRSTDSGGFYFTKKITITIRDVNEKPTACALTPATVRENPFLDTSVGKLSTSDPDSSQSFTYSILDSANGRFKLSGSTVKVATANTRCLAEGGSKCAFNYESSTLNRFSLVLRTTDSGKPNLYYDCKITVDLTNVNDQPRNLQMSGYTLKEGSAISTVVGTLTSSDEDAGQTMTYTLTDDDGGRFSISQNKYVVAAKVANFETQTSHHITVRGTDNGSPALYVQKAFTITVLDVKEAPVSIKLTSTSAQLSFATNSPTINENSVRNTVVGTIVAADPDHNAKMTFSLDDSAGGRFKIDASGGVCKPASSSDPNTVTLCSVRVLVAGVLNHEQDALHTIIVRATDNHGLFKVQRFSVKVVDINDAPHDITSVGGAPRVKENINNEVITSFLTSDEDASHKHTYTITLDPAKKFKIVGSRLMTTSTANLNFEAKSSYTVVIRSTDNGSPAQYFEKTFTVTVVDVNEVPTSISLSGGKIKENSAIDSIIGALSTIDPDNFASKRQSFTYTLVDTAQGRFKVSGNSVQVAPPNVECLKFGGAYCKLNFEASTSHQITVQVTDSGSPPLSKDFKWTITVEDVNDKPRHIAVSNTIVKENEPANTVVGSISYTDEDAGQSHVASMTNTDNGQFKLSTDGKQVLKAKPTDYETKKAHKVTIKVTDNGSPPLSISRDIFITVTDVNEAPIQAIFTDASGQLSFADNHARVNENSKIGTIIGMVKASDQDANQQLTFSLDDDAQGHFAVAPTATCSFVQGSVCTAALTVFGNLDHEDIDVDDITVRVTDPHGKFNVSQFTVTVVNINDKPDNISLAGGYAQVPENRANTFIGALMTDDDDPRQTFNYTLVDSANGRFALFSDDLRTVGPLDYEQTPTLTIRIRSTDSGTPPLSYEKNFVIHVIDINEKPTALHISAHQVDENSASNTAVGLLTTSDPDNGGKTAWQTFTYALLDTAGGRFKLDSGTLKVRTSNVACLALGGTSCWLNYEMKPYYTLLVRTTDSGSPPLSLDIAVNITLNDINDRPRNLKLSDYRVHENQPIGTVIGMFSGFDEDKLQHLTYVLTDDDGGRFKIVGKELQKAQSANYELFKSHRITVVMKDDGTPSLNMSETYLIEVLDVNEAPVQTNFTDSDGQLTFTTDSPMVEENSPPGTIVGTIIAIDADYNQTLTFELDDDAAGLFNLNPVVSCKKVTDIHGHHSSCQVQLLVVGELNYEVVKQHNIVVRVTDQSGRFNVQRFTVQVVDANDVPHDIQILAWTVDENSQLVFISDFVTLDEDKTHTHTYTITSNPDNQFAIVNNSLYASPTATLNYEKQQNWTITIVSTDNGSPPLSIQNTFVIYVEDVNEVISNISLTGDKVRENSPVNTVVGQLRTIDPDNFGPKGVWQNSSCAATSNAGGIFAVHSDIIKVAQASIDYEMNTSFTMSVRCTDDGHPPLSRLWTFILQVVNVNEPPTSISITSDDVKENKPTGTVVGLFHTVDPDNEKTITQTFTYSFVHPVAGLPFNITGNQLVTMRPLDYEQNPTWPVIIRSTDSGGLSTIHVFQISVVDLNEPPTALQLFAAGYVAENSPADSYIGDVLAVDEDANQSHTFEVLGAAAGVLLNSSTMDPSLSDAFVINTTSGVLTTGNHTWDYEVTPSYTVWIRTMDHGLVPSFSFVDIIIVNISDINEAPTNITLDNDEVAENSAIGTIVGHLTVTDPDNYGVHAGSQTFNCSVLNGTAHSFKVVNKTVLVVSKDNLDYESYLSHDIEIQCWDDDKVSPLFMDKQFTINLTNVNEAPVMLHLSNTSMDENEGPRAELAVITAVDPDNEVEDVQNVTFKLQMQNTSDVPFVLVDGNIVEATQNLDFETRSLYTLTVDATDTGVPPLITQEQFNVTVLDMNDPPTQVVLNSSGILETSPIGTVIGTLSTVDGDIGQTYIYSVLTIINVTDSTMFGIRGNELVLLMPVDYETDDDWQVLVQTMDSGQPPLTHQNIVHVRILDVNEAPSEIEIDYNTTIKEHQAAGTVVANFTVIDVDINQTHTCRIVHGQHNFVLVNATITQEQEITLEVARNASLDYETSPVVYATINCTDSGVPPLSIAKTINIKLEDVNEQPTAVILSGSHTVTENAAPGYVLGTFSTIDPDKGQIYTYALFGNGSDAFKINETTSHLEVQSDAWLNFEALTDPYLELIIEVSDNGQPPLALNQTLDITIIDINEPPTDIQLIDITDLREDSPSGTIIGKLYCNNPEKNQTVMYTIQETVHQDGGPVFGVYTNTSGSYIQLVDRDNFTEYMDNYEFEVNATDTGHPQEWTLGVVEFNLTLLDPCSQGTLVCDAIGSCQRINSSDAYCECPTGYLLDPYTQACVQVDNCQYNPVLVDFSPNATTAASSTPTQALVPICQNNATCTDLTDGYNCTCTAGYTGAECDTWMSRCESSAELCQNGASCQDSPASMSCVCSAGYTGGLCQTNIDDCVASDCGTGTCVDGLDAFTCACPETMDGSKCQYVSDACAGSPCGDQDCVPKMAGGNGEDEGPIVITSGTSTTTTSSSNFLCVPTSKGVVNTFTNGSVSASDRALWKDLILTTSIMGDDGSTDYPDDMFILPGSGGGELIYIVILNGAAIDPTNVDQALRTACQRSDVSDETKSLCHRWSNKPEGGDGPFTARSIFTTAAPSSNSSGLLVWGVVAGLGAALLLITILVTCRVHGARKKMQGRREEERQRQADYHDAEGEENDARVMYSDGVTGRSTFVPNPLYHDPLSTIYGPGGREEIESPIYTGDAAEEDLQYDTIDKFPGEGGAVGHNPPVNNATTSQRAGDEYARLDRTGSVSMATGGNERYAKITQAPDGGLGVSNPIYSMEATAQSDEPDYDSPKFDASVDRSKAAKFQISQQPDPFSINAEGDYADIDRLIADIG